MNRVWMITGAGRGLGRAFAEEAVKNGDKVIATIRKINEKTLRHIWKKEFQKSNLTWMNQHRRIIS